MTHNGRSQAGSNGPDKDRCDHRCHSEHAVSGCLLPWAGWPVSLRVGARSDALFRGCPS
jgi:hypothetical protein